MNTNCKLGKIALGCMVVLALFSIQGCTETDVATQQVKNVEPAFTLKAKTLFSEYKANEVAADAKYKGKIVVINGKIQDIGKDVMDQAYIVVGGSGLMDGVQCTFSKGENDSVASLSKGQIVSVKGEVAGKMGNVLLNKASLQ